MEAASGMSVKGGDPMASGTPPDGAATAGGGGWPQEHGQALGGAIGGPNSMAVRTDAAEAV